MADLKDDELVEFLGSEEPNEPVHKQEYKTGKTRPGAELTKLEARKRRKLVGGLLSSGASTDEIIDLMARGENGALSERAVHEAIADVAAEWEEEDAERKRHYKAAAVRRIQRHIVAARDSKSWQAVANLEKVLMMIQGTAEPLEVAPAGSTRLTEAVLNVLGELDPRDVRKLVEGERVVAEQGARVVKLLPTSDAKRG